LWDKESNHSIGSWVPPNKFQNDGYAESRTASLYGRETTYEPAMSRTYSPAPSQRGYLPPPGYHSGRNTPSGGFQMPSFPTGNSFSNQFTQPAPSRPTTNYLGMALPTRSPEDMDFSGGPTDDEIDRAVQDLLHDADLNTITKREIRRRLEERFSMDLTPRKATINAAIDRVLLSHA